MSDLHGHLLDIDPQGVTTTTHPAADVEACGFDEYIQRDWQGDWPPRPSHWRFIRRTDDETGVVDWLGSRLDGVEP